MDSTYETVVKLAKTLGVPLSELGLKETTNVADVVRHGQKITLPEGMSIDAAINVLAQRKVYEEQKVGYLRTFNFHHLDGAHALIKVMEQKYGWAQALSMWEAPPIVRHMQVSSTETLAIPFGRFKLPGVTGWIGTGWAEQGNQLNFQLTAQVARVHEEEIKQLGELVQQYVNEHSIYRGRALTVKLGTHDLANNNGVMPDPTYLNVEGVKPEELIFSDEIAAGIATNVFTPIEHYERCRALGIPFKRGILFAGNFGTGKTLAAMVVAKKAIEAGITFIYCQSSEQFASVVDFAKQYGRAVVFCEDIDKVMHGVRDIDMNAILNVVDGLDAKLYEIMVILTTNEVERIHPAMLRPGRLDAVINVKPPDAKAAERLIRMYGRGLIGENRSLRDVGMELEGQIPAVIREVVERAKLSAVRLGKENEHGQLYLDEEALLDAAQTMNQQLDLLNQKVLREPSDIERAAHVLVNAVQDKAMTIIGRESDDFDLKGYPGDGVDSKAA